MLFYSILLEFQPQDAKKGQATCGTRRGYYRCFLPDLTGFITFTLRRARPSSKTVK